MKRLTLLIFALALLPASTTKSAETSLAELEQAALRAATESVADSVVQIRTIGGLDRVGKTLLSTGPTTGLIISEDGYIVSSAFNFAGQPSSILVRLANGKQLAAELVARDKNRLLVLLKVNADATLPVPEPAPYDEAQVGRWAVAVGRTFQAEEVGVSVGIVSALKRKYGRVLQTDANVSVANYGGPLVDVSGRVLGVLVPMSPQSASGGAEDELAGAEFYDSGIGFAVPLEHVLSILERWKAGEDLLPGKLGIGLASGDAHVTPPRVTSVWPKSPAAEAGWQADDLITAVDGKSVSTQAQLRFQIMPRYAEDTLRVKLKRGDEEIETDVTLAGELAPYRHPFLGILPARKASKDQPLGATVRKVWPESPADQAGLQPGDRITKINETEIKTHAVARSVLASLHPEQSITIELARDDEELELSAVLSTLPEEILSADTFAATEPQANVTESKRDKLMVPEFSQEAVYYSPTTDRDQTLGLLLWLGDADKEQSQALIDRWQATCDRDGLILLIAPPADESWKSGDLSYLQQLTRVASRRLNIDRRRMVVLGQGKAGQLAYALALRGRSAFAGVVSLDAPLPRTLTPRATSPKNRLAVLAIESKNQAFVPLIRRDIKRLRKAGYPTSLLQRPASNDDSKVVDASTRSSIARWLDGLDRY